MRPSSSAGRRRSTPDASRPRRSSYRCSGGGRPSRVGATRSHSSACSLSRGSHSPSLAAMVIVVIAETGRVPADNPDTHLELTMIHEGMLLEYSGRPLGILLWASLLKQIVLFSLVASLFFPFGVAAAPSEIPVAAG